MSKAHRGPKQDMGASFQKHKEAPIQTFRKEIGQHQDKSLRESQVKKRQKQQAKKEAAKMGDMEYLDSLEKDNMGNFKKIFLILMIFGIVVGGLYALMNKFGMQQFDDSVQK